MKMSENSPRVSLTHVERQMIKDLIAIAPEAQKAFHKLLTAGYAEIYQTDFAQINPISFLLYEFVKRSPIKKV